MLRCHRRYVAGGPLTKQEKVTVLDVGGANVNGSYSEIFNRPPFVYRAADMAAGPGVDILLDDPYKLPLPDQSFDLVISGQTFEHCEFFWKLFEEMVRVVKPGGFIFLIVPSTGAIHRYPVDCYRFYPDAFAALAKYAGCRLLECWRDERGQWLDLVGVFRRADGPEFVPVSNPPFVPECQWNGIRGADEEEVTRGQVSCLALLARMHRELAPTHYLEIGVTDGASLALALGPATGVDPAPQLKAEIPPTTRLVVQPSDEFFESPDTSAPPDFCFINGLHRFEQTLRDFMNFERRAAPGAVVLVDGIFPNHPAQAERDRRTQAWTGDVWRFAEILRQHRPDLFLLPLDTAPCGALLIAGLNPQNRVLWETYNPIVRAAHEMPGPSNAILQRHGAVDPSGTELRRAIKILKTARNAAPPPDRIVARLRGGLLRRFRSPALPPPALNPRLSVIVIGYNMARELPRTIRSLSPAMQRGIAPDEYEVILIDNGSTQPFDEAKLRRLLPGLIIHRFPDPKPSPVPAINFGLKLARGNLVGVWIDGARMASPGLLAHALSASAIHERPVIGTLAFHLGSVVQMQSIKHGYDQSVEDALLASSGWEQDSYRLFDISCLSGSSSRGWFELPSECNALFLRAAHWRALGGFDERFTSPGGGLANHDIWLRACNDPTAEVIQLLGEATFHQIHGGIATNNPRPPLNEFHAEYERIRRRPYERPIRRPTLFGSFPDTIRAATAPALIRPHA